MNPYQVLEVSENSMPEEIKAAYKNLATRYNPQKYTDATAKKTAQEKSEQINEASAMLMQKSGAYNAGANAIGKQDSKYALVQEYIEAKNYEYAQHILDSIDEIAARRSYLCGIVALRTNRFDEAAKLFEEAHSMDAGNEEYKTAYDITHMNKLKYTRSLDANNVVNGGCCNDSCCSVCIAAFCTHCLIESCCKY